MLPTPRFTNPEAIENNFQQLNDIVSRRQTVWLSPNGFFLLQWIRNELCVSSDTLCPRLLTVLLLLSCVFWLK